MAKIDLAIPSLKDKFFDLRNSLPGDCYKWSWERHLDQIQYIAIHHTASDASQTPKDIAEYHIKTYGWGGIGYHFLIDKEGNVFYVGDLKTARANVAGLNEQVIGIAMIGNFTKGQVPTDQQLDSAIKLCDFFITNFPNLPNVNSWVHVKGHKELPNQKTICPGDSWEAWKQKILSGLSGEKDINTLKSQVDNLQTSLALLEQQRISLQQTIEEREQEIATLKIAPLEIDDTLTIMAALVNLYKFIFLPRKVEQVV